jgi:RNA polymerase sigma-70 factor (ECF subfamily)
VEVSDAELMRRVGRGDEDAFRQLFRRHHGPLYRFSYRMAGPAAAEDVVQDCFLSLLRRPAAYDPERGSVRTYLYGIARHLLFRHFRRSGVEQPIDDETADERPGSFDRPDRALERRETSQEVAAAVGLLPPLQREALVLFEYEERSLAEIAEIVGAEVGTVSARLHRARERLRRQLRHLLPAARTRC